MAGKTTKKAAAKRKTATKSAKIVATQRTRHQARTARLRAGGGTERRGP
jgi:hypothetical protein